MPNAHPTRPSPQHAGHAARSRHTAPRARADRCGLLAGALALLLAGWQAPSHAFDLGGLGKVTEGVSKGKDAVSTGQQAVTTGREAVETGKQMWNNRGVGPAAQRPSGPATMARDEGGPTRLIAVLGDGLAASTRAGNTLVGLLDQGPYFVQRQSAYSAPAQGQLLVSPRAESTTVSLDLPADPPGTVFDLASGRSRPSGGKGVKVYALSVHAELPLRRDRRALDAIEQHAQLKASSVQMEWPRQPQDILEPVGGKLLVWASESGLSFPSGFGVDGKLFTPDDPMVSLPRGYTVVTLDRRGFIFDRSREIALPFHGVRASGDIDLSRLQPGDALQAFASLMSERYPYMESRPLDWTQIQAEFTGKAQQAGDPLAHAQVYFEIAKRLRDGLVRVQLPGGALLRGGAAAPAAATDLGLMQQGQFRGDVAVPFPRVWLTAEGPAVVSDVAANSPAAQAGLRAGAEVVEIDGDSVSRYVERASKNSSRSTEPGRRLEALELLGAGKDSLALRVRLDGKEQQLDLRRPRDAAARADTPPEGALAAYQLRSAKGKDYAYIAINSFADANGKLELWERSLAGANQAKLPGLVIDLRGAGGGTYQLVPHLLATFFSYDNPLRPQQYAQRQLDADAKVWRTRGGLGLPTQLPLFSQTDARYAGKVVVLAGQGCAGPCEVFTAWLQRAGRAAQIVGTEATAGSVGHTIRVSLPGDVAVHVPMVSELTANGESYVDGKGIEPTLRVPVNREFVNSVMAGGDPVLDAAVRWLDGG